MNVRKNVLIHFLGKLIPAVSSLLIMAGGIRYLGKTAFGKYNLMFSAAVILSSLFAGWVQQSILRFLSDDKKNKSEDAEKFFRLGLVASLLTGLIAVPIGVFYFKLDLISLGYYAGFSCLFVYLAVRLTLFQASFQALEYAIVESFFYLLTVLIALYFLFFEDRSDFMVYYTAMFISLVIVSLSLFFSDRHRIRVKITAAKDVSFFKKAFAFGFPLTIWMLIASLLNYLDRFVINHYAGYEAVGVYSSVYDFIYKVSGFLSLPILLAYHPAISNAWNKNDVSSGKALILKALWYELLMIVTVFVVIFLLHEWIFHTVFHLYDAAAGKIFIPLALSSMLWQMSLLIQKPLEFNARQKMMIAGVAVTVVCNLVLNSLLIPFFGFTAAAWVTLGTTLFYFLFVAWFASREFKAPNTLIV